MTSNIKIFSSLVIILGWLFMSDAAPKESEDLYFVTLAENQIIRPKKPHIGTVIFLHGMNVDNEPGISGLINMQNQFQYDIVHIKVIFPRAPQGPYTPHKGELRYIWYDEELITPYREEKTATFEKSYRDLRKLIQNELDSGVPLDKILIGGIGQGGTIAMHIAYRFLQNMTGVFAIGSFLHDDSLVYKELYEKDFPQLPRILMMQGTSDDRTLCLWGEATYDKLRDVEVRGEINIYQGMEHEVNSQILVDLWSWVLNRIPDTFGPKKRKKIIIGNHMD